MPSLCDTYVINWSRSGMWTLSYLSLILALTVLILLAVYRCLFLCVLVVVVAAGVVESSTAFSVNGLVCFFLFDNAIDSWAGVTLRVRSGCLDGSDASWLSSISSPIVPVPATVDSLVDV